MPALAATREFQRQMVALRAVTYSDVTRLWALLDMAKLDASFPLFAAATLRLVQARRETATTLAKSYLVTVRRQSGADGQTPVVPVPPVPVDAVLVALRYSSVVSVKVAMTRGTDLGLASRNALVRTMGEVDKFVGDGAREWIRATVEADPAAQGWRRRTLGTCEFCAKQAAGEDVKAGDADFERHPHCGCEPEPVYEAAAASRYDVLNTVDDVARMVATRTGVTLRTSGLTVEQARLLAGKVDELAGQFPDVIETQLKQIGTFKDWPEMVPSNYQAVGLAKKSGSVAVSPGHIYNAERMAKLAAEGARTTADPMHTVVHEIGHLLGFASREQLVAEWRASGYIAKVRGTHIDDQANSLLEDVLLNLMRQDGARIPATAGLRAKGAKAYLVNNLSTYGAGDVHEAIAECFAEVAIKGTDARPFAIRVVTQLRAVLVRR